MEITPTERTIVEYGLTLTSADAAKLRDDPYTFAEELREALLPHLPTTVPVRHKPTPGQHITIGRNGRKGARTAKAPKGAKLAKVNCPECGKPVAAKFLPLHQARKHAPAAASASSPE